MTSARHTRTELTPASRAAVAELLLSTADDEFVIGFSDSEWTGIAPMLEEDVAMSSLAQDELGHARAFYELLAGVLDDGRDADALAYDRQPEDYRHCRLLDHGRGDWATTICRRFLYDTADGIRLDALAAGSWAPLTGLVGKIRREERYHRMHAEAWFTRLGEHDGEPRRRLLTALDRLSPDAATVFSPLAGEGDLIEAGILEASMDELETRWRAEIGPIFDRLALPIPGHAAGRDRGRLDHSDDFRTLWSDFTSVRRLDPAATW